MRKFDCIGDQRIYEGFMAITPNKNGLYKEVIDEGLIYEETIKSNSLTGLLEQYFHNYISRKMPESILAILKMAIEDSKEIS
jgi:hypothetical protein